MNEDVKKWMDMWVSIINSQENQPTITQTNTQDDEKVEITLNVKANEYADHQLKWMVDKSSKFECVNDFIAGYLQCKEDNKDKRFSLEDLQWAIHEARYHHEHSVEEIIQSLTQPKDL